MTDPAPATNAPARATAEGQAPPDPSHDRRSICLVISCVLAPLAMLSNFVRMELLNTDRYVSTVAPLVAQRGGHRLRRDTRHRPADVSVNVQKLAEEALPAARRRSWPGAIATGVQTFVEDSRASAFSRPTSSPRSGTPRTATRTSR